MDAILIGIKAASGNEMLEISSKCPNCGDVSPYMINLVSILSTLKSGDYATELEVKEFCIKFRPLTFKELNEAGLKQFELQKSIASLDTLEDPDQRDKTGYEIIEQVTLLTMELSASSVEYVKTDTVLVKDPEFILDFLKNCDRNIYNEIRDHNAELKSATEIKPLQITCPSCSHEYEQSFTLNPTDFFG